MPTDSVPWSDRLRRTLECYDEPLLRQVAARLFKPRSQWPAEELIERSLNTVQNAPVLDRRLGDLDPPARQVLGLIGHSRQPRWHVGNLVELLVLLGHGYGMLPIIRLLQAGLLYPDLAPLSDGNGSLSTGPRIRDFEQWLGQGQGRRMVYALPLVTGRLTGQDLGLPECPGQVAPRGGSGPRGAAAVQEADGLEWPLKLAVLWQQVAAAPLRRTQQGGFFKRDLERLQTDALLNAAAPDSLADLADPALLAVELALGLGLLREADGELRAGSYPASWEEGLAATIASLWATLLQVEAWNPHAGWQVAPAPGNPYPSAYLLALLLLSRLPAQGWASPEALEDWIRERHPYWDGGPAPPGGDLAAFLLGLAYQLRLLQATRDPEHGWLVRLSPLGRWLVGGGEAPELPSFAQTLLVQPNLEVLAYRQGLTPALVGQLGRFATWKGLGPACTLQLQPESVYRALESGETFETIVQALQRHGMKPTPDPVVNSLRTWANKRERIQVYAAAALFEFNSPEELNDALARGLPAVRLSERLAVVARESDIDYRHFRLAATRDYALPAERCVEVEGDGVTLSVDLARSDLMLETEVRRFAEPFERPGVSGRRFYRLTRASVAGARANGLTLPGLEGWFLQRSGQPLSPAARLLLAGPSLGPLQLRRLLILSTPSPEVADGLQQWAETRPLIEGRLGPTALVVAEENMAALQAQLDSLGIKLPPASP
jgi:hypothetical protein